MTSKKTLLLILLLSFSHFLFAQDQFVISGTVTDKNTGETLIGAGINVVEYPNIGILTNKYGYFSISLPRGKVRLNATFLGYKRFQDTLDVQANTQLIIKIEPTSKELGNVEVSSKQKNDNIRSSSIGKQIITISEISKIPVLLGEADIMKTLQLMPGIKSMGEGSGGTFVRGGNNSQNLVLLDEAPVFNSDHLLGFFSTFNSDAIKGFEIYKGTAPAQYGGRTSSVLDVKMNDGNNQKYHFGGGIGLISSRLWIEGPIVKDKGSFLITGRRTYMDLFLKFSSNPDNRDNALYFYDLNIKANYKINSKNRIYLSGYFGRDVLSVKDVFGFNWGNLTGTLRWNHIWSDALFSNTSLIYSDYDYKVSLNDNNSTNLNFNLQSIIRDLNLKQEFDYFLNNKNTLHFGFNIIHHNIIPGRLSASSDTYSIDTVSNKYAFENSLYASNSWKPNDKFSIDYGVRLSSFMLMGPGDFYSYNDGKVSDTTHYKSGEIVKSYLYLEPRVNAAYIINETNSVKASYTRNTQNLHLISNSTSSNPTDFWVPSSNNVRPEIGDQISMGYFSNTRNQVYNFSGEIYYRWMSNQIDLRDNVNYNNFDKFAERGFLYGRGRAYGLELLAKKNSGHLTGWISYTFSRTERKFEGINNGDWYPARQDIIHDISIVLMYQINKKWTASTNWVYQTGYAATFPNGKYEVDGITQFYYTDRNGFRMPAYHRLDIGLTRTLTKSNKSESSLNFSVYNAYGHKNPYSIRFKPDEINQNKLNATMTYLFTFVPSVTYNFKF